jgi:hypothetical protein
MVVWDVAVHGTDMSQEPRRGLAMSDPKSTYLQLKGDLQTVLGLPLEGRKDLFRDFLVGYLVVERNYSEERARGLVVGNEKAILVMLTEEHDSGMW